MMDATLKERGFRFFTIAFLIFVTQILFSCSQPRDNKPVNPIPLPEDVGFEKQAFRTDNGSRLIFDGRKMVSVSYVGLKIRFFKTLSDANWMIEFVEDLPEEKRFYKNPQSVKISLLFKEDWKDLEKLLETKKKDESISVITDNNLKTESLPAFVVLCEFVEQFHITQMLKLPRHVKKLDNVQYGIKELMARNPNINFLISLKLPTETSYQASLLSSGKEADEFMRYLKKKERELCVRDDSPVDVGLRGTRRNVWFLREKLASEFEMFNHYYRYFLGLSSLGGAVMQVKLFRSYVSGYESYHNFDDISKNGEFKLERED
ncbi:MAG: hypothetical protein NZ480_02420 [Bdellovibrionaceae bacterium]|nr:hypothetical protein [Pseudobdellovibrionaceae bacterium]MDW8190244.1 hypothetical protein [Pseudobdellovibrionaceae bacterium]